MGRKHFPILPADQWASRLVGGWTFWVFCRGSLTKPSFNYCFLEGFPTNKSQQASRNGRMSEIETHTFCEVFFLKDEKPYKILCLTTKEANKTYMSACFLFQPMLFFLRFFSGFSVRYKVGPYQL